MEKSVIGFKARNPEWEPTAEAKQFLQNVEKQTNVDLSSPTTSAIQQSQEQENNPSLDWVQLQDSKRMLEKSMISVNNVYRRWYSDNS